MVKTYLKTLVRVFKKHIARFISIVCIVLVSVGFISGIGGSTNKIDRSLSDYYKARNVSDFILKSKEDDGFKEEEYAALSARYGENNVNAGNSADVRISVNGEEQLVRLYFLEDDATVNVTETVEEQQNVSAPEHAAAAEQSDNRLKGFSPGTQITIDFKEILRQLAEQADEAEPAVLSLLDGDLSKLDVTVTKTVLSPLTFALDGEPSYLNDPDTEIPETIGELDNLILLDNILYLSADDIPTLRDCIPETTASFLLSTGAVTEDDLDRPLLSKTGDLYVALSDREVFNAYSAKYDKYVEREAAAIADLIEGSYQSISLHDNYSFKSLHGYADKVMSITILLMVAFLFITALVVLSNMTRLMEEERSQVACLRTLGYGAFKIIFKYILFAMLATGIGGIGSYFIGIGVSQLIYIVFNYSFVMPPLSSSVMMWFYLVSFFAIVLTTLLATVLAGARMMREKPAELLRPKPPKAGKKVILERIPFLWNMLSFKYKSTMRNVLRYKSRFLMTVVAVAGSMGLVLAGLALIDMCLFGDFGSPSILGLAILIVVFAGLLTAVVIYTLTNINISERNREIATLMVLGYHDKEVAGYIYREIYINTVVGILFGYPAGVFLMWFVFTIVNFGSIATVSWFVWLTAPFITLLFTFLVTLALRHKIVRIDMNESLKAIE